MNYYRLSDDINYPNRWYLGEINIDDNWILTLGKPVDGINNKNLSVEIYKEGATLDYSVTEGYGVPIISEAFAECLNEFKNEVQIIPVSIAKIAKPYYILVITNIIDCVDEKKSDFKKFTSDNDIRPDRAGDYEAINILKIDNSKIQKDVFRLAKYNIVTIVSEKFKTKLENRKLNGLTFELVT